MNPLYGPLQKGGVDEVAIRAKCAELLHLMHTDTATSGECDFCKADFSKRHHAKYEFFAVGKWFELCGRCVKPIKDVDLKQEPLEFAHLLATKINLRAKRMAREERK